MSRWAILAILVAITFSTPARASTKYAGWIEGATATAITGQQFTAIQNYWTVPAYPVIKNDGQIVTMWDGLETASGFALFPTLVWGTLSTSPQFGNYSSWQIAPVEVNGSTVTVGGLPQSVSVGDVIEGIVEYLGQNGASEEWVCEIRDYTSNSAWITLEAQVVNSQNWIYAFGATLGADANSDSDLPGPLCGADISYWDVAYVLDEHGAHITPTWVFDGPGSSGFNYNGPECGSWYTRLDNGEWWMGL